MIVSTQRFLCVMPLDVGLFYLGYIGLVSPAPGLYLYTKFNLNWYSGDKIGAAFQFLTVSLLYFLCNIHFVWPLHMCMYVLFMTFSAMLIVARHMNKIWLVKIYCCYLYIYILLMVLLFMFEVITTYHANWIVFVLFLETVILTACQFGVKAYLENNEKTGVNGEVFHIEYKRQSANPNIPHASAPFV